LSRNQGPRTLLDVFRSLLAPIAPPLCFGCGAWARTEPLCAGCRSELRFLGPEPVALPGMAAWAPLAYDGPARALVSGLKFRGAEGVARAMAAFMALAPVGLLPAGGALVPVPLHPARLRTRGFNQAERLAAAVAARSGLPLADPLHRRGGSGTQMGRSRAERLRALDGCIGCASAAAPEVCVLVDDVMTTGAGARRVGAIAFARTPGR
jgi:predicted amidophosphoribosyltransferase